MRNTAIKKVVRFNELKRLIPGISSNVLANRLLALEREGLISKKIYQEIPIRVEYSLTARVKELKIILEELDVWAQSLHCNTIDPYSNNVIIQNKRRDYQYNLVKKK